MMRQYKALPVQLHSDEVQMAHLIPFLINFKVVPEKPAEYPEVKLIPVCIYTASTVMMRFLAEKSITIV